MTPGRPRQTVVRCCGLLVLGVAGLMLTGCGSNTRTIAVTVPAPPIPTSTTSATSPAAATAAPASAEDKAAPPSSGPPDFVLNEQSQSGDKLKLEGRFGPVLPASESDVDQSALSECPEVDGRELITRLDVTATIESGLAATVDLKPPLTSSVTSLVDFMLNNSEGLVCTRGYAESEGAPTTELGTMQPHEPSDVTMWLVLVNAITPNNPHPTTATLAHERWLLAPLQAIVDNSPAGISDNGLNDVHAATGPRVVTCESEVFIAIVKDTVATVKPSEAREFEPTCPSVP
jgi:hypothetical protein